MGGGNIKKQEGVENVLSMLSEHSDVLFDYAPVMMHAIDKNGRLVKVNRRWLETLGYQKEEVLGRKSIDFLTQESRERVVKDALPLFWHAGSARSVGCRFVRKDGQMLDVLLDAEVCPASACGFSAYAAIHVAHDPVQWEQASQTLRALREITAAQSILEGIPFAKGSEGSPSTLPAVQHSPGQVPGPSLVEQGLEELLEATHDISVHLRGLEEYLDETVEQRRELVLVAKNTDKTLAQLADTVATTHGKPD